MQKLPHIFFPGTTALVGEASSKSDRMAVHINRRNLMVTLEKTNSELLNRIPESAIERAAITLLNLHDIWE
jgi:hypothetical protein